MVDGLTQEEHESVGLSVDLYGSRVCGNDVYSLRPILSGFCSCRQALLSLLKSRLTSFTLRAASSAHSLRFLRSLFYYFLAFVHVALGRLAFFLETGRPLDILLMNELRYRALYTSMGKKKVFFNHNFVPNTKTGFAIQIQSEFLIGSIHIMDVPVLY